MRIKFTKFSHMFNTCYLCYLIRGTSCLLQQVVHCLHQLHHLINRTSQIPFWWEHDANLTKNNHSFLQFLITFHMISQVLFNPKYIDALYLKRVRLTSFLLVGLRLGKSVTWCSCSSVSVVLGASSMLRPCTPLTRTT